MRRVYHTGGNLSTQTSNPIGFVRQHPAKHLAIPWYLYYTKYNNPFQGGHPVFFRHAKIRKQLFQDGVKHCTFNPNGPGVVRIHLIPPRFSWLRPQSYIVILNGYYLLPIGYAWALLLWYFIDEVNRFDSKPISPEDGDAIFRNTVDRTQKLFPAVSKAEMQEDLDEILRVLFTVAHGNDPQIELKKLSLRAYADQMTAPHRMDLMISAMTTEDGRWNCNQQCHFCYAAGQPQSGSAELDTASWKTAIDRLNKARVPMVTFTGGEPTMRDDLAELVAHAKHMITRLNTNGIRLTPALAQTLKEAGLDSVQVTLYSHNEAVHNELVGGKHFSDTVQGIRNAVDAGLDISINTPLCRLNRDYDDTLRFVQSLGVRFVTASGLICTGAADASYNDYDLTTDELTTILRDAKTFCDCHEMEIDFTSPGLIDCNALEAMGMNVPMCGAALSNMAIAPDGTVVPCQSWLCGDAKLGNILTDRFEDIWHHPTCKALRTKDDAQALACPFRTRKEVGKH